jgi:hypothetical protein
MVLPAAPAGPRFRLPSIRAEEPEAVDQIASDGRLAVETAGNHQTKMTKPGCRPITLPEHKGQTYSRGLDAAVRKTEPSELTARV